MSSTDSDRVFDAIEERLKSPPLEWITQLGQALAGSSLADLDRVTFPDLPGSPIKFGRGGDLYMWLLYPPEYKFTKKDIRMIKNAKLDALLVYRQQIQPLLEMKNWRGKKMWAAALVANHTEPVIPNIKFRYVD